jgi:hypothetical protein
MVRVRVVALRRLDCTLLLTVARCSAPPRRPRAACVGPRRISRDACAFASLSLSVTPVRLAQNRSLVSDTTISRVVHGLRSAMSVRVLAPRHCFATADAARACVAVHALCAFLALTPATRATHP